MGAWLPQASSLVPRDLMQAFPPTLTSLSLGTLCIPTDNHHFWWEQHVPQAFRPTPYHALNRSVLALYPSRLLIIQSLELSPVLLQVLHSEVLPSLLGVQGSKDFPASRCVASAPLPLMLYHLQRRDYNAYTVLALPNQTTRRTRRLGLIWLVNPCGNFSDTSSLKLVKLKDRQATLSRFVLVLKIKIK